MSGVSSSRAWQNTRLQVLARDGYRCQLQLEGCTTTAPVQGGHMHHTVGRHTGLDQRYLVASCRSCNLKVGRPEWQDPPVTPRTQWSTT